MLGGCDNLSESPEFTKVLSGAEAVSRFAQKAVAGRTALAREYTDADLSAEFCANGTTLANSIEPIGGSSTKQPTGPVVFVGAVKGV